MTPLEAAREALNRAVNDALIVRLSPPQDHEGVELAIRAMIGAVRRLIHLVQGNMHLAQVAAQASADYLTQRNAIVAPREKAVRSLDESHAGGFWHWLQDAVDPTPESCAHFVAEENGFLRNLGLISRALHSPADLNNLEWVDVHHWAEGLRHRLPAIASDFHTRLAHRAAVGWVLERYARRCRRLRLQEMTELLNSLGVTGKRELALTRDAALFLFDQGFEILIEQAMGSHRYDIIGIGEPLLVEAKIYDGKRRGLAAVVEGLSQIHQYANTLADEGVHGDPVLLVFRLGGPRATPVPEYKIGNLRVTIAHVDLGTSSDSGSEAPPPEPDITEAAIAAELERKAKKPVGKDKRRRRGR